MHAGRCPKLLSNEILAFLVRGSASLVRSGSAMFSGDQWTARAIPGTNPPGYTLWHMARALDWTVQCGVRGVPEVATLDKFKHVWPEHGIGTGIAPEQATEIARNTSGQQLIEYAEAVAATAAEWLLTASNDELAAPTALERNQAQYPVYRADGHLAEVRHLFGIPNWQLILRPAGSHIRTHNGELEVLQQAFRA